jgi:TatD DNase family protein
MELIDSHCHLDLPVFDSDRDQILQRCHAAGVNTLVIPGISAGGWPRLLTVCGQYPGLFPALGLHPMFMAEHSPADLKQLHEGLADTSPVAIGEIGLDFHSPDADRDAQTRLLAAQLELALEFQLPVLLHVRKAHDQVLALLRRYRPLGGIAHAFSGSLQQARQYIDLGFCLGFGGMLTFERSRKLRALARELPLTSLVLETDAPDMTVSAHRGGRNSPEYLPDVLASMAVARGMEPGAVAAATRANTGRILPGLCS